VQVVVVKLLEVVVAEVHVRGVVAPPTWGPIVGGPIFSHRARFVR
jgi:hypothetical protein